MRNFSSGKSVLYVLVDAATHGFTVVLITELVSRQNTFVGGTCALLTAALLVVIKTICEKLCDP